MYIYFISSDIFGENIHKLIHSTEQQDVVEMLKAHQLLYKAEFNTEELTVDMEEESYLEFLENIDCHKGVKNFYRFEADMEEFTNLLEAYCAFSNKLNKIGTDKSKSKFVTQTDPTSSTPVHKSSNPLSSNFLQALNEHQKVTTGRAPRSSSSYSMTTPFASVDLKDSRVSYIYDDKADTMLAKQVENGKHDPKDIRDVDYNSVLEKVHEMTSEEWHKKSKEMNDKVNEDGATANLVNPDGADFDDEEDEDESEVMPRRALALVNNILMDKRIVYFEEDEVEWVDHPYFNEFLLLNKFLVDNDDLLLSIIMQKLEQYARKGKQLTNDSVSKLINKTVEFLDESDEESDQKVGHGVSNYRSTSMFFDVAKSSMPNLEIINQFMKNTCAHVSGSKVLAKDLFNKFSDYVYENGLTMMSNINKSTFTKVLKKHFTYKRYSSGMYWVDMRIISDVDNLLSKSSTNFFEALKTNSMNSFPSTTDPSLDKYVSKTSPTTEKNNSNTEKSSEEATTV